MKQKIKILHLYSKALDLYGDHANIKELALQIEKMDAECEIITLEHYENTPLPEDFDMVYIGHGKARNLEAVAPHFLQHSAAISAAVEKGKVFLVTGNARLLFGHNFESVGGHIVEGIGFFPCTAEETGEVFVCDVLGMPQFNSNTTCYGFINRTCHLKGVGEQPYKNEHPLFALKKGFGDTKTATDYEGTLYKNFFGTFCMGPILLRNPQMLKEILKRLMGELYVEPNTEISDKALGYTLAEFEAKSTN